MVLKDVDLRLEKSTAIFEIYNNIIVLLKIKYKINEFTRRVIYSVQTIIIPSGIYITIFIEEYYDKKLILLIDKDFFFKF